MKPHELVNALFKQRKDITSVSALARAIHNQGFQGTLHKFLAGQIPTPTAATAGRIAKFFQIPLEALYDPKVATRVARERGLLEGASAAAAEDLVDYQATRPHWPFKRVNPAQLSNLSPAALTQLERLITAYVGGPLPSGTTTDHWREVAVNLAATMDDRIGKPVFTDFVQKVDEMTNTATHAATPELAS